MDKETVGNRLALWALAQTYGRKGFGYATPIYKSMEISGNKIYINVENAQRGLCPMWTSLEGFEIAGEDKVFYPAFAEIETSTVCRWLLSVPIIGKSYEKIIREIKTVRNYSKKKGMNNKTD